MPSPARIAVVGSCNMDLTYRVANLPRPGETVAGTACPPGFGGKGANQAVMAARLGASVAMVGRIGRDPFGTRILVNFQAQGIDTDQVGSDSEAPTGVAVIFVDDLARNCIVVAPGANHFLAPADITRAAETLRTAQIVLAQLEVPVMTILEAFRIARSAGVTTILNPAPAAKLPDELLGLTDFCVPNETELETLTGTSCGSLEAATHAARALRRRGPGTVIVTLGERGALIVDEGPAEHVPATPVVAVDPTGAGDAFTGSLAVFLAEGLPLPAAARRANEVAAWTVARPGAQASFPLRADLD